MGRVAQGDVEGSGKKFMTAWHKEEEASRRRCCLLLFLTFSVLVANPKKLLYTVANPARGLLNREKRTKKKSGSLPPPHPPHCSFVENK